MILTRDFFERGKLLEPVTELIVDAASTSMISDKSTRAAASSLP